MPTESGDQKLLGNYRKLIDMVFADTNYNPTNGDITKPALAAHYTGSLAALDDVTTENAPHKMATSQLVGSDTACRGCAPRARAKSCTTDFPRPRGAAQLAIIGRLMIEGREINHAHLRRETEGYSADRVCQV